MEDQPAGNAELIQQAQSAASQPSFVNLLKVHRELLVGRVQNTQCLIDNLLKNEYFSTEDAEIASQYPTQADKVRKILDLAQSKGEEVAEYCIYVLQQVADAYYELHPWLEEIGFCPSEVICNKPVENTDPVSRYHQKLKDELGRDTKFIMSYAQKDDRLLEETYAANIMEFIKQNNEKLGSVNSLEDLLSDDIGLINEEGETIYVFGDAGIGKSILLQKMQNLWSKGEFNIGAKFFFRFRCRMFSCFKKDEAICLKDLLFKYNCFPDQDPDEVFDFIVKFPHTVLFTFDGFDEIHSDFDVSSIPEICSPNESIHPLALLVGILSGKLLKGSRKILTARTGTEVHQSVVRKKVHLQGFSSINLKEYTKMFFKDEAQRTLVLNQLEANPNLSSLCSVPLFCWIIFRCFDHFHSEFDTHELPDVTLTLTDIFLLMTEVHLNRAQKTNLLKKNNQSQVETYRSSKETLFALSKIAHGGMQKSRFVFDQDDDMAELSEQDLHLGFLRPVPHYEADGGDQSSYEFLHLILQSFFTAFFLVTEEKVGAKELLRFFAECSPQDTTLSSCFPIAWLKNHHPTGEDPFRNNEHFHFTNLFLCGLLSKGRHKLMRHLVSPASLKKKRKVLLSFFFESMKYHLKGLTRARLKEYKQLQVKPNFVWMLRCIYETQSEKIGKGVAKNMSANYIKLTYCNAYSADCSAISFVMNHFQKQLALDLDNNNINDYGIKQLLPCFRKLTVLSLYNNQITDIGAKYVARLIEECPSLTYVKIGANKITTEGGKSLAYAIQKSKTMYEIGMWGNQVGDEGAKAFAEALRNHPTITNVSLAFNGITTEGGKSIAEAMKHNSTVNIFWLTKNELDDEAAECFAEMIKVNKRLGHLWLIQNQITARGAKCLADALQDNTALKEICLNGNPISQEEAKAFESEKRLICF
ncbi:nucleotide-binding oligomerization domain-containing protein 1 isoform X2 [Varanus komodoensis]|uniref:nucleotide-binding oligomerization domain-containing protein 1 isoform X2 n=1 Tax=Varanus komodoensis TaxID=61221 RepID=UPI001CF799B3|nr:nucleotide-binding oligomerization domain-containing protein 1 isoform X2 [Varanus komodoensis]